MTASFFNDLVAQRYERQNLGQVSWILVSRLKTVSPAKAGAHRAAHDLHTARALALLPHDLMLHPAWVPAFAGTTGKEMRGSDDRSGRQIDVRMPPPAWRARVPNARAELL